MTSTEKSSNEMTPEAIPVSLEQLYGSPAILFTTAVVSVFVSDTLVMLILSCFDKHYENIHHLLDAVMLVALLVPILFFLVYQPLTLQLADRRRTEEELAAERNKLRGILDAMPSSVCIVNQAHGIEYANSALTEEFGPIAGRTCFDYFHGRSDSCPNCHFDQISAEEPSPWEWYSDKTGKTYEVYETPLRNADGTTTRLASMRDVTARKQEADELRASRERLRALSDHLQRAREEERRAIGREIHDELGQVLATVQLGVSSLAEEYQHHPLNEKIVNLEQLLARSIGTVRKISSQLRPTILDELGLADAIEWQVSEFTKHTGLRCSHHVLLQGCTFNKDVATAIFRICQEALTNVIRHSGATHVDIVLEERNERIILLVRDNGRGITPEQLDGQKSLGIIGMRERAYMLGGRVKIRNWKEGGTVVFARIPCNPLGEPR